MFLEEEDLHFYTLVDDSRSMGFGDPTKLRFAQQLAAALGYIGLVRSDRVCIDRLSQPLAERSPRWRGRQSLWRMQEHVAAIEAEPAGSLAEGVKHFCLRNTGKGILVLITDLMDKQGYAPAMRMLLSQQMDVYVIHVLSPEEIDPDVQGDLRLIDCEDQDAAEITVSAPLLRRYKQTLDAFVDGARDFCSKRGMAYVLARSDMPVEDLVMRYLRRRGLVR
jgi:uncharacterized protein (DUF58 family)